MSPGYPVPRGCLKITGVNISRQNAIALAGAGVRPMRMARKKRMTPQLLQPHNVGEQLGCEGTEVLTQTLA